MNQYGLLWRSWGTYGLLGVGEDGPVVRSAGEPVL